MVDGSRFGVGLEIDRDSDTVAETAAVAGNITTVHIEHRELTFTHPCGLLDSHDISKPG